MRWGTRLGAAAIALGLCLSPARGDEVEIAFDRPFSLVDADGNTVTSRDFSAAFDKRIIGLTGTPEQIADLASPLGIKYDKVLLGDSDYVVDHNTKLSLVDPHWKSAVSFAFAEPYLIAAELLRVLDRSGAALGDVKNIGAYR